MAQRARVAARRRLLAGCVAALVAAVPAGAVAQAAFPARPLTLVVPYPPGGVADQFARKFAESLGRRLGQPVVVDNRAGANGNVGSAWVARQQPADGHTLLLGSISNLTINPNLYQSMGYDPVKDLQPVTLTHQMPNALLVGAGTPYRTVADVVAAAKARPDGIAYGSAGNGNTMHMTGVQFEKEAGIKLTHVPYKGGAPALNDVLGGQLPTMFNNLPAVVSHHQAGKVRILAVSSTRRSSVLPDVPTFAEAGYPGVVTNVWNGILVRQGTPAPLVERLNQAMVAVLESPEFRQPLVDQGYEVLSSTPQQMAELIARDTKAMAALARHADLKME